MSRERGQLPLAETDREDNDSISEIVPTIPDPEPALEALRDVYANLVDKLYSPSVIEHLYSVRLLSKVEYDLAKSKESNYDKNTEVLGALMRRGRAEVVKFCQVLFERNQHNCGRLLLDALHGRGVDVSSVVIPSQTPPVVRSTSPKYYIEMEDLNDAFITLVREVKKVGVSLDPEDLRTICIELLNGVSSTKRNVQEDIDALQKCDGNYIRYLQPYWDSLECNLLHRLIRQLNKPELIGDWEQYRTQVKEACTATLEECRNGLPQGRDLPPNQISVGFQTTQPPNDVTVQKMLDLKDFLIKRMGLEEADFAGFTNSDVTLFFTVSRSRLPFLVRMCALHRKFLQDVSITVVFVPGEFIYDVITDQEFPYPEAALQRTEPVLQIKDLKEVMLHQFEQLQTSKINEDAMKNKHLQHEAIQLKMKLKEEEMLRTKAEEEQRRIAGELVKVNEDAMKYEHLQNESLDLKMKLKEEELLRKKAEEEQRRKAGELKKMEKKWSMSSSQSNAIPKKAISDVEGLLGQSSESVEGLQDKIRILVEEWSKISEHERSLQLSGGGTTECEDELFALAYKDGVKDKYMCHVYEKSERYTKTKDLSTWMYTTAQLQMVITYSTSHWSQIVQEHYKPNDRDWKLRTVIQDFIVEGDVLTANMPESTGLNWSCAIDGIDKVPTSSLDFTKRFPPEKDGPKSLEQAVKSSFYPPKIALITSSDIHPLTEYNRSRFICLEIVGSSPGIRIPVHVVDRVEPGMREPEEVSKPHIYGKVHERSPRDRLEDVRPTLEGHSSSSLDDREILPHPMKTFLSPLELEEHFSPPSPERGKHLLPSVQKIGMTKTSLRSSSTTTRWASSKEKDQQAN